MSKYHFIVLSFLLFGCSEEGELASVETESSGPSVVLIDPPASAVVGYQVVAPEELKGKYGLEIFYAKDANCRWSDDKDDTIYGIVEYGEGGNCTAVTSPGGTKVGIGCLDANGEVLEGTKIGA